ncbi:MAG: hypothetical protein NT031_00255 [Planctomycetota bacterium]|nr:hypothetical protein [Planctomycetota bacterium]
MIARKLVRAGIMTHSGQITPDEYRQLRRARLGLRAKKQPPADSGSSPPATDVDGQ